MCSMFLIRKATNSDIRQIKTLFQETILTINVGDYTPKQAICWAMRGDEENIWKDRIRDQYFIVAEKEKQIVGFAALKPDGYFNSLFVHKDFQKHGIASLLLSNIEEQAQKDNIKEITVDVSITAKPFFEQKGYQVLTKQIVDIGVKMINYKMAKFLIEKG